ncbi:MAG TPA: phosphopyruvate hydratase, partial [Actinomycetota bacterium]
RRAVRAITDEIAPALAGADALDQRAVDLLLIDLDGTETKSRLGANAILGVSLAVAAASASDLEVPLFRYVGGADAHVLPVPLMNVLNGGVHADNNLDVQEFMIVPHGAPSFSEAVRMGVEVYQALKAVLKSRGLVTAIGDEGGFAPNLENNESALRLLVEAIERSGYEPGAEVSLALDVAASELFRGSTYRMPGEGLSGDASALADLYDSWLGAYPIVSIEDPLDEEDWDGWRMLTSRLGGRCQIVGDDVFVTNTERLTRGIELGVANALLVKVNQIGTLTETAAAVRLATRSSYAAVMSHRSGETEDATIADLAVAWNTGEIKTGAPARSDRVAKYNQLLRIEQRLSDAARFAGTAAFARWLRTA